MLPLLAKFVVMYVIFETYLDSPIEHFALYLFIGLIVWEFFARTTGDCMRTLKSKKDLLQKLPFPPMGIILSSVWSNCIILGLHAALLLIFIGVSDVPFAFTQLLALVSIAFLIIVSASIGLILTTLASHIRDIPHLWNTFLQILFWLTPVFYRPFVLDLPTPLARFIALHPVSFAMTTMREFLLGALPFPGLNRMVLYCVIISFLMLMSIHVFQVFFSRESHA